MAARLRLGSTFVLVARWFKNLLYSLLLLAKTLFLVASVKNIKKCIVESQFGAQFFIYYTNHKNIFSCGFLCVNIKCPDVYYLFTF